jgi:signal peptidase I
MGPASWPNGWVFVEITDELKKKILEQPFFKGKIVSGSMIPVIEIGEEIMVEVKAKELKRFDIIVFVQHQKLICHYLWTINKIVEPRLMQTRSMGGGKDFPISEDEYVGRVISHHLNWWHKLKIIFVK